MNRQIGRLLTGREVCERLRITRVTLWEWRRRGLFPAPIVVGTGNRNRWLEEDVEQYIAQQITRRAA